MTMRDTDTTETGHKAVRVALMVVIVAMTALGPAVGQAAAQSNETTICGDGPPIRGVSGADGGNLEVALVNDRSGSMALENRMDALNNASSAFVARLESPQEASAVSFGPADTNDARVDVNLTGDLDKVEQNVSTLEVTSGGSGTYLEGGIELGTDQLLNSSNASANAPKAMVILTDADSSSIDTAASQAAAQQARDNGITVIAIGLGSDADEAFLETIATSDEYVYMAPNSSDLDAVYEQITTDVSEISTGLTVETRDLYLPGATHDYRVYEEVTVDNRTTRTDVTGQANVTVTNSTLLTVDESNATLTALDDEDVSDWARVDAAYNNSTGCTNVIVSQPTTKNIELLPGIWRANALVADSTIFALIIAMLLAVPTTRFTSAFGGLAVGQMVMVVGWLGGYVSWAIAASSLFVALFIGLNLAANVNYGAANRVIRE